MQPDVTMEAVPCPLGCPPRDTVVVAGGNRLHGLPGRFTVVRCEACGLMRTNPRPTQQTIGVYYPAEYAPHQRSESLPHAGAEVSRSWRNRLTSWARHNSWSVPATEPGRMIEIGCGPGAFLRYMADKGWDVTGLEFSERAAAAARAQGFRVVTAAIDGAEEDAVGAGDAFDLVVGWMVVEHLHDPIRALTRARRWCRPGGWLAISVPDAGAFEFRVFKDAWYGLALPIHLYHFTPVTIRRVLDAAGWAVQKVFWHSNPNNLLQSLRSVCADRGWARSASLLLDFAEGRRFRRSHAIAGKVLGALHASGRMTVWARRA